VNDSLADILEAQEIEVWPELVMSRELSATGKNLCRVNGTLITLTVLKEFSDRLVDVHGQHEHQSLLSEKNHIAMLDGFDPHIEKLKTEVAKAYSDYSDVVKRQRSLFGNDGDRERRIDILKFQINEIKMANIAEGEEEELAAQKARLNSAEKIMDALSASYTELYEGEPFNALAALKDVSRRLQGIAEVDERYEQMAARVDEAYYTIEEVSSAIRDDMGDDLFDVGTLEQVEERLALIASLKRKYGDPAITGEFLTNAEQELNDLVDSAELLEQLAHKVQTLKKELHKKSMALSELRRETARVFEQQVTEQLKDLGMMSAVFSVNFVELADIESCSFSKNGFDTVEFYMSTNRGEPQKPLKKIASGGEVSRIMLALKNIVADRGGIPTMIFDEIDTGISGHIAQVVAEKLQNISRGRQVVCVTHLPQIASMADKHFLVTKKSDAQSTRTYLLPLEKDNRIEEIARLAGGESEVSKAHALEMIKKADIFKNDN
jgi:DNA repair protein RecN (Recombination protein N)